MILTDTNLAALCIYCEAWMEPDDGRAAIARVIQNRMASKYSSDGTVFGTVLKYDQFSWAWFAYVHGKYTRVSDTTDQAKALAEFKFKHAPTFALKHCSDLWTAVKSKTYKGQLYDQLTDDVVLYLNPHIVSKLPDWATADKLVCTIQNHQFYRN